MPRKFRCNYTKYILFHIILPLFQKHTTSSLGSVKLFVGIFFQHSPNPTFVFSHLYFRTRCMKKSHYSCTFYVCLAILQYVNLYVSFLCIQIHLYSYIHVYQRCLSILLTIITYISPSSSITTSIYLYTSYHEIYITCASQFWLASCTFFFRFIS